MSSEVKIFFFALCLAQAIIAYFAMGFYMPEEMAPMVILLIVCLFVIAPPVLMIANKKWG